MFFAIPNLRSSAVFELEKPWAHEPKAPAPYDLDKGDFTEWASAVETEHAFISSFEGTSPEVRVTESDNPPFKMHGLVVDYDLKLPENPVDFVLDKPPSEHFPAYLVRTHNNARLIWQFEKPVLFTNKRHMREFIKQLSKNLKLAKWLGGIETEALNSYDKYYEIGQEWLPVKPDYVIRMPHLELWFVKAADGVRFDEKKELEYNIPVEDISEEVEARYPGKWRGPFTLGARGVRFWDSAADNETAAVVTKDGMVCFTGDQAFVPWRQLFGAAFVDKYEADYVAQIIDKTAYDGRMFWVQRDNGTWRGMSKEDFSQHLRVRGYEPRRKPGATCSEVDRIEETIKLNKDVEYAVPFLFHPPGVLNFDGTRYLNTARTDPMEPAPPYTDGPVGFHDGRKHFPFTYKLLRTMFTAEGNDNSEQLIALLAWMKHFYANSYLRTPRQGHAVVIVGPTGKGKSLFSLKILGALTGKAVDASDHLVRGCEWTAELMEASVLMLDDTTAIVDKRTGAKEFSNRIKKYVAMPRMRYRQMYRIPVEVPMYGRIVITCNPDPLSLRMIPDMDLSNKDKICLFLASDHKIDFPDEYEIARLLKAELPMFARFLLDWPMPESRVAEETRFGVKAYHHPELLEESRQQGNGILLEMLTTFTTKWGELKNKQYWYGTGTELYEDLIAVLPDATRAYQPHGFMTALGRLLKNEYNVVKFQDWNTRRQIWRIGKNLDAKPEQVTPEEIEKVCGPKIK